MKLQKQFKSDINIVLVNPDQKYVTAEPIIKKREKILGEKMNMVAVYDDTSLLKLFPHNYVPHLVWVNRSGVIIAITQGDKLNEEKIREMIEKGTIQLEEKSDYQLSWDFRQPLFESGNGSNGEQLLSRTVLSKYVSGLSSGNFSVAVIPKERQYYIAGYNLPVIDMYRVAYSLFRSELTFPKLIERIPSNLIEVKVRDSVKYFSAIRGVETHQYRFVYETRLDTATEEQLQRQMQRDMDKFFGLNVRWKKMKKKCLVLSCPDTSKVPVGVANKYVFQDTVDMDDTRFKLSNPTCPKIISALLFYGASKYGSFPYPLVDETHLTRPIAAMDLEINLNNHKALDKAFSKYGLRLQLKEREVDVLEISEPENYTFPYFQD